MFKTPTYIEIIRKLVQFLGLNYSEDKKSAEKFKMLERSDFVIQGGIFTTQYAEKIQKLFAGEDEEKRELVRLFLVMSESLARELTSKNYYTLASQKRAMWGLLIFYYIPHIACLMGIYKKEFGIPECLVEHNFMLPFVDDKGKVIQPTLRLTRYLTSIERIIDGVKFYDASNELNSYIKNLSKKSVPTYKKHQDIIDELRAVPTLANKISEISLIFRAAIVSADVYDELCKLFGEHYALSLVDYFRECLKSSDRFWDGVELIHGFDSFFHNYTRYYKCEFLYTSTTHKRLGAHFTFQSLEGDDVLYGHNELKEHREEFRAEIFEPFKNFLELTDSDTKDDLFEIDTNDLIKSSCFLKTFSFNDLPKMGSIKRLLNDFDCMFSCSDEVIQEDEVSEFLQEFKSHPFYKSYEHEYLYYDGLNELAKNDFESALVKLNQAAEKCMQVTAGETQLKITEKLIVLTLLTEPNFVLSSLKPKIRMYIDAELEKETFAELDMSEQKKYDRAYFQKVLEIISRFNSEGYGHYDGVSCVKYNPFEKVERFLGDFYQCYDDSHHDVESQKKEIRLTLKSLRKNYRPDNKLVTFYQYTTTDVFDPFIFNEIYSFCSRFQIDSKNITKLGNDQNTLIMIFEALST
jgi:hypothetical protein